MKFKLNNKEYNVPELTMSHFTKMEEQGFSVVEAFQKGQMMLVSMGFVCAVVGCEREEAERLITQHVLGGGKIADIINAFTKAVEESVFFQKMLKLNETTETAQEEDVEPDRETEEKESE